MQGSEFIVFLAAGQCKGCGSLDTSLLVVDAGTILSSRGKDSREANPMFEDDLPAWKERIEAAQRAKDRLGPLAAEKAKQYEGLTLEEVMARWAEVMSRQGAAANIDDLEAEVMAIYSLVGEKMRQRIRALRAGGFEFGEPMQ